MMNGYSYKDLVMPNSFVCENVKATLGRMAKKKVSLIVMLKVTTG